MNEKTLPRIRFAGTPFGRARQVGAYDPDFAGETFQGTFNIPARIFEQLEERRVRWPIPCTEDDLLATWLGPHRLLLFVNIADPKDTMRASLEIDGRSTDLRKAYSCVYPQAVEHTFVGFYADVSSLQPDVEHSVKVTLPAGMEPGQFQGLYFDNVETEFTEELSP